MSENNFPVLDTITLRNLASKLTLSPKAKELANFLIERIDTRYSIQQWQIVKYFGTSSSVTELIMEELIQAKFIKQGMRIQNKRSYSIYRKHLEEQLLAAQASAPTPQQRRASLRLVK